MPCANLLLWDTGLFFGDQPSMTHQNSVQRFGPQRGRGVPWYGAPFGGWLSVACSVVRLAARCSSDTAAAVRRDEMCACVYEASAHSSLPPAIT